MRKRYRSVAFLVILAVCLITCWIQLELVPASPAESRDNKCRSKQMRFFHNNTDYDNGAIILFYHIAKTGGTTIRRAFANISHVKYVLVKGVPRRQVDTFLKLQRGNKHSGGKRRRVLFLEFHGISPGLPELSKWITSWRRQCKEQNIRFFAFTLLRDPVALHVSAFTFFHRDGTMARNTSSLVVQDQLLQAAVPNRQCHVLYHGQGKVSPPAVASSQCDNVRHYLCHDWDWIGTTEKLNKSTLPALFSIVHGKLSFLTPENIASANVQNWTVAFSLEVRQRLHDLSSLDWDLYKFFQQVAYRKQHL